MSMRIGVRKRAVPIPRWGFSGVQAIDFQGSPSDLIRVAELLPQRRSSIDAIAARLSEIGGRYHRYLSQDELGPTRAERAQALKVLIEKMDTLLAEVKRLLPQLRIRLAEELLAIGSPASSFDSDPVDSHAADKDAVEAIAAAAASLRQDLSRAGAADKVDALDQLCSEAATAAMLLSSLDTTTDGDIAIRAWSTDLAPVADCADAVSVHAEQLRRLRFRLERELVRLKAIKGPESSTSLQLVVAQLSEMWRHETGQPVTANPYCRDNYTGRPQTEAGRFVVQAMRALQPSEEWIDRQGAVTSHKRIGILVAGQGFLAQAVHTAMRKYVAAEKLLAGPGFQEKHTL